jgi:hypothetical protein
LKLYGDNIHYHTDLGVAGAEYHHWVEYLTLYQARDPPPPNGTYPDDHLVLFLDNGNSYIWAPRLQAQTYGENPKLTPRGSYLTSQVEKRDLR